VDVTKDIKSKIEPVSLEELLKKKQEMDEQESKVCHLIN
jgi:hypothetical protein